VSSVGGIRTAATSSDAALDVQVEQPVGTPRQFPCFDGLRTIAVVLVLLLHTAWTSGFTLRSSLGIYAARLEIGVSIFFLISGFLLYRPFVLSQLTGERSPNTRRFWQRRLLRIVPAYWLALTVLTYGFHLVSLGPGWQGVVGHYLFLQIYFPNQVFSGIGPAWSLCVEMSFYLFLPLYAWMVRRTGRIHRSAHSRLVRELVGVGVLFVISFVFRYWFLHIPLVTRSHGKVVILCAPHCATRPPWASLMVDWLPANLDLFALGMLLAILSVWFAEHRSEPRWLQHRLMPWVSWLLAAVSYWEVSRLVNDPFILYFVSPHVNLERQTLYGIFALLIIAPAVFGPQDQSLIRRLLRSWPMASVGVISYGIYLWHVDLISQFLDWTGWRAGMVPFWLLALAVFALSAAVASASYFGLERPILRIKRRMSWWDRGGQEGSPQGDSAAEGAFTERSPDAATTVPGST
jgi:peptidoglycan/LPS O-acetylase OafA/YrhL